MNELERVMATITPENVYRAGCIAAERVNASRRPHVALESICEILVGSADIGQGQERAHSIEQIRLAIREAARQSPHLKYISGGS